MIGLTKDKLYDIRFTFRINPKNRIIVSSIIIAIIFYFLDAVIYYLVFAEGNTFLQTFITAVPLNEIYNRLILFMGIMMAGFIGSGFIGEIGLENEFLKQQQPSNTNDVDTEFITGLSYQIRTPLNAIVGFSELLKDPNLSAQSKQTYINHIHSSGSYLLQLINNISDISKIDSDQMVIEKSNIRINELFDELMIYFRARKREFGRQDIELKISKHKNDQDFVIQTDGEKLKQVLTNLLEIAYKSTEEGFIELGYTLKEKNMVEMYVRDTGKGFSTQRLEAIFNRYNKLSSNHNQPFDGVALRLSISKSLVRLLGGEIRAVSKPGHGNVFYFTLPHEPVKVEAENSISDPDSAIPDEEEGKWNKHTLLIAEDVESNFIYLQELLRPTGANIIWAKNGIEAVKIMEENKRVELILMDILMPEMDGYEAAKRINEIRPGIPVIAQTAYSLERDKNREEIKYFDHFLIKPIWSPQLLNTLEEYFS